MKRNPILDFEIDKSAITFIGHDLQRPERGTFIFWNNWKAAKR